MCTMTAAEGLLEARSAGMAAGVTADAVAEKLAQLCRRQVRLWDREGSGLASFRARQAPKRCLG